MNQLPRFGAHLRDTSVRDHYESTAQSLLTLLWRRRGLILTALLAGLVLGIAGLILIRKTYTADALVQLTFNRDDQARTGAAAPSAGPTVEAASLVESEARVLKSRAVARRVVARLNLVGDPDFSPSLPLVMRAETWLLNGGDGVDALADPKLREDLIAQALARNLAVTNDARSYIIGVSYTSPSPERSAKIVNAFIDEYINNTMEAGVRGARRTSDWIAQQIRQTRIALDAAEASVNAYRRQSGYLESSADGAIPQQQQLQTLSERLDAATMARLTEEARVAHAKEVVAGGGVPSAEDLVGAPVIQSLIENREKQRRELAELTLNGPKHPGLARARAALDDTEARLRAEIEGAITQLDGRAKAAAEAEAALAAHIEEIKGAAIDSKKRETKLKGLQLDATSLRDRLKILTESYAQAVAAAGLASTNAQVVMRAESIPIPSGPNPVVILAVALLGAAAFGVGAALLLDGRRKGFRSDADLAAETQTPCLGTIPDLPASADPSDRHLFDEAIRFVSASLDVQTGLRTGRILLLTSSVANEGKSAIGQALAEQAAKRNDRVLVIDVASRQGKGSAIRTQALSEALDDPDAVLAGAAPGSITRLAAPRWVVSDTGNAARLADFVSRAKASFDLIVLEVPPVLSSLDFLPLAKLAEQVIHLVRSGTTPRACVSAALKRFDSLSVRLCGTLMTHVDPEEHRRHGLEALRPDVVPVPADQVGMAPPADTVRMMAGRPRVLRSVTTK